MHSPKTFIAYVNARSTADRHRTHKVKLIPAIVRRDDQLR